MKLGKIAEKKPRPPKAKELVRPEADPSEPNKFFDYQRDVPTWLKRSVETNMPDINSTTLGHFSDLKFVRSVLGIDSPVNPVAVQNFVTRHCEDRTFVGLPVEHVGSGGNNDLRFTLTHLVDLNAANALLPTPDERVEVFNQQAWDILNPQWLELVEGLDVDTLVDFAYKGYQLYPARRSEYSRIVRERLEAILEYYKKNQSDLDEIDGVYYGISKLAMLLPEAKEILKQFVDPLKKDWIALARENPSDSIEQDFPGLYCFMLLAQDEVGVDQFGRLQVKKPYHIPKFSNLPVRPQV